MSRDEIDYALLNKTNKSWLKYFKELGNNSNIQGSIRCVGGSKLRKTWLNNFALFYTSNWVSKDVQEPIVRAHIWGMLNMLVVQFYLEVLCPLIGLKALRGVFKYFRIRFSTHANLIGLFRICNTCWVIYTWFTSFGCWIVGQMIYECPSEGLFVLCLFKTRVLYTRPNIILICLLLKQYRKLYNWTYSL